MGAGVGRAAGDGLAALELVVDVGAELDEELHAGQALQLVAGLVGRGVERPSRLLGQEALERDVVLAEDGLVVVVALAPAARSGRTGWRRRWTGRRTRAATGPSCSSAAEEPGAVHGADGAADVGGDTRELAARGVVGGPGVVVGRRLVVQSPPLRDDR